MGTSREKTSGTQQSVDFETWLEDKANQETDTVSNQHDETFFKVKVANPGPQGVLVQFFLAATLISTQHLEFKENNEPGSKHTWAARPLFYVPPPPPFKNTLELVEKNSVKKNAQIPGNETILTVIGYSVHKLEVVSLTNPVLF